MPGLGIWQARLKSCRDLDNMVCRTLYNAVHLCLSDFPPPHRRWEAEISGVDFKKKKKKKKPKQNKKNTFLDFASSLPIRRKGSHMTVYFLLVCDATYTLQHWQMHHNLSSGCIKKKKRNKPLSPPLWLWQLRLQFLEASSLEVNWIMQCGNVL